jgi:hypothetical protein
MNKSESIGNLSKRLAVAQGKIKNAAKDQSNPFFKSKYADMASVYDACREALSSAGIAVFQPVRSEGTTVFVTTLLACEENEWLAEEMSATAKDAGPQALASCTTMLRRYGISSMVGIAGTVEDDDGNAATNHASHAAPQSKPEAEAVLAQTDLWNRVRENHGEGAALDAWVRKALGNPTRSRNKLGKWGFTEAEFLLLKKMHEADEKALREGEEALK